MVESNDMVDGPVDVPFAGMRPDTWPTYHEQSLFWSAVIEAERELQVSREMAMMSALGAMSVACQGHIDVEYPDGHRVQTPLMLLTLAESGERKTTVQNKFFKAIIDLNREAIEVSESLLEAYTSELTLWQQEIRARQGSLRQAIRKGDDELIFNAREELKKLDQEKKPKLPKRPRLIYDDTTPQALVQLLNDYSPYGCLLTSEANSIFSGRALQELDKLNTLWDGGDVIVDRMTRSNFILTGARLTLALMTQPSVIDRFLSKRGEEARGMGFLARFLVVKPREMAGNRRSRKVGNLSSLGAFNERVKRLLIDSDTELPVSDYGTEKEVMRFSAEASTLWEQYHQGIEEAMQDGRPYFYYKDHGSKLMENISRMAAVIHYFEGGGREIPKDTLRFCYEFALKCSQHFQRHLAGEPEVVADANELAKYLIGKASAQGQVSYESSDELPDCLARGLELEFSLTDIKQYGPYRFRGRESAKRLLDAIDLLKKMGHLVIKNKKYLFRENILSGSDGPELRNGMEYHVGELPLFDEQKYYQNPRSNFFSIRSGFYLIKPGCFESLRGKDASEHGWWE